MQFFFSLLECLCICGTGRKQQKHRIHFIHFLHFSFFHPQEFCVFVNLLPVVVVPHTGIVSHVLTKTWRCVWSSPRIWPWSQQAAVEDNDGAYPPPRLYRFWWSCLSWWFLHLGERWMIWVGVGRGQFTPSECESVGNSDPYLGDPATPLGRYPAYDAVVAHPWSTHNAKQSKNPQGEPEVNVDTLE